VVIWIYRSVCFSKLSLRDYILDITLLPREKDESGVAAISGGRWICCPLADKAGQRRSLAQPQRGDFGAASAAHDAPGTFRNGV